MTSPLITRRAFLLASTCAVFVPALARADDALTPENFGAKGDGIHDDHAAWTALVAEANRRGRATVRCRAGAVYRFAGQVEWDFRWLPGTLTRNDGSTIDYFVPERTGGSDHLNWIGLRELTIEGNGATLVSSGDFRLRTQDLAASRQPRKVTVIPLNFWKCRNVTIRDLICDGEWRRTTCSTAQFSSAAINPERDTITLPGHEFETGTLATITTDGVPPGGLLSRTRYAVEVVDAGRIRLRQAPRNPARIKQPVPQNAVDLTSGGEGLHTLRLSVGQRFAYGIRAVGCSNLRIERSQFNNYMGDGIACTHRYSGGYFEGAIDPDGVSENWELVDVKCLRNGRQGISPTGCKGYWRQTGGSCSYTGFSGSGDPANVTGVTPGAGMDFEPDRFAEYLIGDCVLTNVELVGNSGAAIILPWNRGLSNRRRLAFSDENIDQATGTIRIEQHKYPAYGYGHKVRLATDGRLPSPLKPDTDYWVIRIDADRFRLAAKAEDAAAGRALIFADSGSGTHAIFVHDTPSLGKSCRMVNCVMEHPANAPSDLLFQVAAVDCQVIGGVIRNLKPSAAITSSIAGDSSVIFKGVVFETVGKMIDLMLGTAAKRNRFRYGWTFENCELRYIGTDPIYSATRGAGLVRIQFGDARWLGNVVKLGSLAANTRSSRAIALLGIAEVRDNRYEVTATNPTGPATIIDYSNTERVSGERYVYPGERNPFQLVGVPSQPDPGKPG